MKKLMYTLLLAVAALGFTSCDEDRDSNPVLDESAKTFVLNMPSVAPNNVIDLQNSESLELTTSQPNYGGMPLSTVYKVWVSLNGEEFVALPSTYTSARLSVPAKEINQAILDLAGGADLTQTLPVHIKLTAALYVDSELGKAESNVITLPSVLAYVPVVEVTLPEKVYIVGGFAASEGWSKFVPLNPAYSQEGFYYGVVHIGNGEEFKITPDAGWKGTDMGSEQIELDGDVAAGCTTGEKGSNLKMAAGGWYVVVVKAKIANGAVQYTLSFREPNVYLIGGCINDEAWAFGDAGKFPVPASATDEWVSPEFTSAAEIRVAVDCGIDWWKTELTLDGNNNIFFRNVDIPANWAENVGADYSKTSSVGGHIYLNFTTGTGRVE